MADEFDGYVLSEEGKRILEVVIRYVKRMLQNQRPVYFEPQINNSSDVYVALPPPGGIPALSFVGTSDDPSPMEGDTPGSAECDIYRIVDGVHEKVEDVSRTVYNLSTTKIPYQWISIKKEKYGSWIADFSNLDEIAGSGSVGTSPCYTVYSVVGVEGNDIPISLSPTYALTLTGDGVFGDFCLARTPIFECGTGT